MKKAFTVIEVLVVVAIIALIAGFIIASVSKTKDRTQLQQVQKADNSWYSVGKTVYVKTFNITGIVNNVCNGSKSTVDLLVIGTNGTPTILTYVDVRLLSKD